MSQYTPIFCKNCGNNILGGEYCITGNNCASFLAPTAAPVVEQEKPAAPADAVVAVIKKAVKKVAKPKK